MFQDYESEVINIYSKGKTEKNFADKLTNSDTLEYTDQSNQTVTYVSVATQLNLSTSTITVDETSLAKWLENIYPLMISEMKKTKKRFYHHDSASEDTIMVQRSIIVEDDAISKDLLISKIVWNCTGNTFIVTYCKNHESWCRDSSTVQVYTKDRNGIFTEKSSCISMDFCVTSAVAHPSIPSIFAVGAYEGTVLLINIGHSNSNEIIKSATVHQEKISQILWTNDETFVSCDVNGEIIKWKFTLGNEDMNVIQRYRVTNLTNTSFFSVTAMAFSKTQAEEFIVGCEGGKLFKCSSFGAKAIPGHLSLNPVVLSHESHEADVNCLEFGEDDIFLSSSTDGEIRLYRTSEVTPFLTNRIDNPIFAGFLPPMPIVMWFDIKGNLSVWDISSNKSHGLRLSDKISSQIAINLRSSKEIVIGDLEHGLQIININWMKLLKNIN